ncbi:MAG: integrin, partial [Burkholderiales bacterium]|nr:integrin [Burkholderiales bacterium]
SNTAGDQHFGTSLFIDGDTMAVGAPREDNIFGNSGAAYVFTRVAGIWSEQAYLKA